MPRQQHRHHLVAQLRVGHLFAGVLVLRLDQHREQVVAVASLRALLRHQRVNLLLNLALAQRERIQLGLGDDERLDRVEGDAWTLRQVAFHLDNTFYADAARIALQSIFAHKLRAFLTLIGIIIGVASVVVVGAAISGLNTYVVDKMSKMLGTNHFMIARVASHGDLSEEEWEKMNRRNKRLRWADMEWLQAYCESCTAVGAEAGRGTKPSRAAVTR